MTFFGILLILMGLPLLIFPVVGVPMIILGIIMILSSIGSSNAKKTANALAKQMSAMEPSGNAAASSAEAERWAALAKYDEDIRQAVTQVQPLGSAAIDRLRTTYLALNDKSKLPVIVADIETDFRNVRR
ncbi:hypothetical protein QE369_000745 [Agrobacterium larrymoorei]|uniref:Uncharacterized protein n=1 Tax=Agrobacterium larrymoorei TaxID=160699 RepID=A0AAJ2B8V4_9HYPH|nr:hypothetical protein [Agrobacterium larrymoorei]MDR6100567.1 hypothetical protein [Agrobacterium larrymoorei]